LLCFLVVLLLVVEPSQLDFQNVFSDDVLVVANRLNPYQLMLAVDPLPHLGSDVLPSLPGGVGPVKYRHLVLLPVDESYQVIKAARGDQLSNKIGLFICIVKKFSSKGDVVVYIMF
jgi:hypothetical protein